MLLPVLIACGSAIATGIGGLVAMRIKDRKHLVLGATGGVLLGVIAFDLVPEAFEGSNITWFGLPAVMILLVAGFLSVHTLEKAMELHQGGEEHYKGHHHDLRPLGLMAGGALVAHSFLDGLGIGLSFSAGAAAAVAVSIAVLAHDFADGFNTYTLTSLYGNDRRRALTLLVCDALAPILGAVVGSLIVLPEDVVALYLAYFAGFLLYIATGTILPEAHADHPSWGTLVATILGVVFMGAVVALVHGLGAAG